MRKILLPANDTARRSLSHVRRLLERDATPFVEVSVDTDKLPMSDRHGRSEEKTFQHTPGPLLRAWRSARQLMVKTKPGDQLLASDRGGLVSIFALMQASLPQHERRLVWTVAANSKYLELRFVAGAHSGLPEPWEAIVDWEIVQYRYSQRILATSNTAIDELQRLGLESDLLMEPAGYPAAQIEPGGAGNWWVPGPVSRLNQSGEVLRALTSCPDSHAVLSTEDAEDEVWTGDSWSALRHAREVLGSRVERSENPHSEPDVVVLGDPYSVPDDATQRLAQRGIPIVVPGRSTASTLWPDAAQWIVADDLTQLLRDHTMIDYVQPGTPEPLVSDPVVSSAQRISIGIPIFRDVRFLRECLDSLLAQSFEPFEILLVDDGSADEAVTDTIAEWASNDSRIRGIQAEHRGVCAARNLALAEMAGDAFVFVDSDDRLEPGFLAKCAEMLRSNDSLWAVATWTRFFGGYEGVEAKPPFDRRVGLRENPIVSTTVLVDMTVRDKGIRFEPDLAFLYCEDWHFWAQIVAAGGSVGLVPEALAHHRVHPSSGGHMRTELALAIGKARATQPLRG